MSDPLSSFVQRLLSSKLVTAERLEAVRAALQSDARGDDGEALLKALVE